MNKIVLVIIALICFIGATVMYVIGSDSSHLSELKDYWYLPIPLGIIALFGLVQKKQPPVEKILHYSCLVV
jgi:hypothetical protein